MRMTYCVAMFLYANPAILVANNAELAAIAARRGARGAGAVVVMRMTTTTTVARRIHQGS